MSRHLCRRIAMVALLLAGSAETARAQQHLPIRFDRGAESPAQRRFVEVLDRGTYDRLEADSVLGPDLRIEADLLILGADVRLAGTVAGDVIAVDSDVFLRPGARIEGDVIVLGGGFYSSRRADVQGEVLYRPDERYTVERRTDVVHITPFREPPETLMLHGLSGIKLPTYQRVDEWTFALGATLRPFAWRWEPSLEAVVRWKTEQGNLEGTVRQAWRPNRHLAFGVELERATRTRDAWMRSEAANTLAFLFAGDDLRNYYEADRLALFLRGTGESSWRPLVELELEEASSRDGSRQFVLFGSDPERLNPAIDDGSIAALRLGGSHHRSRATSELRAGAFIEIADADVAGDFTYVAAELDGEWAGPGVGTHGIEVRFIARRDLSGTLPRQRWSTVGGLATLPTEPELARRGSRLLFGALTYLVPLGSVQVGMAGSPSVFGRIAVGDAWEDGADIALQTNLMGGIRLSIVEVGVAFDPGDDEFADPVAWLALRL